MSENLVTSASRIAFITSSMGPYSTPWSALMTVRSSGFCVRYWTSSDLRSLRRMRCGSSWPSSPTKTSASCADR